MKDKRPIENVRLSFRCPKSWEAMEPCTDGRYCSSCHKTVIDFTDKSIAELQEELREGEVCGRFYASQLAAPTTGSRFSFRFLASGILLTLGFSSFSKELKAQSVSPNRSKIQENAREQEFVLGVVESMPAYKYGGEEGMLAFIRQNLQEPPGEQLKGFVLTSFVIDTTGNVTEPYVLKSLSPKADEEAMRMVQLLQFNPGTRMGKKVPVRYTLPIRFGEAKK